MLWSARDPKRKVKLWPHLLTRFTHLTRLGQPAVVDNWTASCDLRAEKAGELAGEVNALLVADPPADADDTLRRGEIDVGQRWRDFLDEFDLAGFQRPSRRRASISGSNRVGSTAPQRKRPG